MTANDIKHDCTRWTKFYPHESASMASINNQENDLTSQTLRIKHVKGMIIQYLTEEYLWFSIPIIFADEFSYPEHIEI